MAYNSWVLVYNANATGTQTAAALATSLLNAFNALETSGTLAVLGNGAGNITVLSKTKTNTGTTAKLTVKLSDVNALGPTLFPSDPTTPFNDLFTGALQSALGQPVLGLAVTTAVT